MTCEFRAEVLLEKAWRFKLDELAAVIGQHFPAMGEIEARPFTGPTGRKLPALVVDGAIVRLELFSEKLDIVPPDHGMIPVRDWDCEPALTLHRAAVRLVASGPGEGIVWAKAYATLITALAGAMAMLGPAAAVHYPASGAVLSPDGAHSASETALTGVSPLEAWIAIYPIEPDNPSAAGSMGALTRGLAPFVGRELALAPGPITPREAVDRIRGAAWAVLDGDAALVDGGELADPMGIRIARVRAVPEWIRPDLPVFVLVESDSVVDMQTLSLQRPAPQALKDLLPGRQKIDVLLSELPERARRESRKMAAAAKPMLGRGAKALGGELKHAPRHGRQALKFASRAGGAAMRGAKSGISAGRSWLAARRDRREEER